MEGRQVLDAPLIADEVMDSLLKRKEKGVLYKLDIEKSYDQINWKFLLIVLQTIVSGENGLVGYIGASPQPHFLC